MNKFEYRITYNNGKKSRWVEWPDIEGALKEIAYSTRSVESIIKNVVIRRRKQKGGKRGRDQAR